MIFVIVPNFILIYINDSQFVQIIVSKNNNRNTYIVIQIYNWKAALILHINKYISVQNPNQFVLILTEAQ